MKSKSDSASMPSNDFAFLVLRGFALVASVATGCALQTKPLVDGRRQSEQSSEGGPAAIAGDASEAETLTGQAVGGSSSVQVATKNDLAGIQTTMRWGAGVGMVGFGCVAACVFFLTRLYGYNRANWERKHRYLEYRKLTGRK